MVHLTRRSMLRGSLALAAAKTVGVPYVAKAAATTATVWFAQGFVQDEDVALRKAVADYEKPRWWSRRGLHFIGEREAKIGSCACPSRRRSSPCCSAPPKPCRPARGGCSRA